MTSKSSALYPLSPSIVLLKAAKAINASKQIEIIILDVNFVILLYTICQIKDAYLDVKV
jgi:hypothetical protein